jgi:hypothetical protein
VHRCRQARPHQAPPRNQQRKKLHLEISWQMTDFDGSEGNLSCLCHRDKTQQRHRAWLFGNKPSPAMTVAERLRRERINRKPDYLRKTIEIAR